MTTIDDKELIRLFDAVEKLNRILDDYDTNAPAWQDFGLYLARRVDKRELYVHMHKVREVSRRLMKGPADGT